LLAPSDNPIGNPISANRIVIHDGGIVRVRVDSNNDGVLNADDDLPAVKNDPNQAGHVLLVNSDDDNLNDTEDKSERPPNFNVPSNGSAFLVNPPAGFSVTVDNEDDLARAEFYVWLDSLDPEDAAVPVEVDVYALAPSDLVMWSKPTKGGRIHRGSDGDGDGRIEVDTRLHTLTAAA
jgi:hypothetical protein